MVDLYGNAAKYERQKSKLNEWPTSPENRRRIKSYLAACVDHLSPGRRNADLWYLRKLFVGTGANKGDPFIKKRLSSHSGLATRGRDQVGNLEGSSIVLQSSLLSPAGGCSS